MAEIKRDKNELMLDQLQADSPDGKSIARKVAYSRSCVIYELGADGGNYQWRKQGAEGTCYFLRLQGESQDGTGEGPVRILVKGLGGTPDFTDTITIAWEIEAKENYVFYKNGVDETTPVRALWYGIDSDRVKFEELIKQHLDALMATAGISVDAGGETTGIPDKHAGAHDEVRDQLAAMGIHGPTKGPDTVQVTKSSLRTSLHGLVDEDKFIQMLMQKLFEMTGGAPKDPFDKKNTGKHGENKPKDLAPQQR